MGRISSRYRLLFVTAERIGNLLDTAWIFPGSKLRKYFGFR
jgi:hypothetical protein